MVQYCPQENSMIGKKQTECTYSQTARAQTVWAHYATHSIRVQVPPMILCMYVCVQIRWSKKLSCNANHQEVSRCWVRDPPWLWNRVKMSPEVQNGGYQWPHRKDWWRFPKNYKKSPIMFPRRKHDWEKANWMFIFDVISSLLRGKLWEYAIKLKSTCNTNAFQ